MALVPEAEDTLQSFLDMHLTSSQEAEHTSSMHQGPNPEGRDVAARVGCQLSVDPTHVDSNSAPQVDESVLDALQNAVATRSACRILATQVDSSGIEDERNPGPAHPTRPVEGRDVRPRRDHRRGLVLEIAPNVVDATAVDLSSSPHDSLVDALELDLPVDDEVVFDPVESDEEEHTDEKAVAVSWEVVANRGNGRPPSRRLRLIGVSVDALPNSRNMHDEVPSTVVANHVPSLPSTIPASSTVLREVHPSPYGRYSVLSDRVDSEPENRVDPTVLDSVEGVVDHRRMPDTDSDSTESVHFVDEVLSDVEALREEIDVEEVEVPLPRWPRRMFVDGLRSLTFARFSGGGHWS